MQVARTDGRGWASAPLRSRPQRASVIAALLAFFLATLTSLLVVAGGPGVRFGAAFALWVLLVAIAHARPAVGVIAAFVYLVFLGSLRRVLLGASDWTSADPLLLVGPAVFFVLIGRTLLLERRPLAPDLISKLVSFLLVMTFAQVFNPLGPGIAAGVTGLVFMAFPLFWFFVGRDVMTDPNVERLMLVVVGLGSFASLYGLWQLFVGHPPWDRAWLELPTAVAFSSLDVAGEIRAFGTFAGFLEYGVFLGSALVAAAWFAFQGRLAVLALVPVIAAGLVMSAMRQPLLFSFLAVGVMAGLRTRSVKKAVAVGALIAVVGAGVVTVASVALPGGGNAFIGRQISGLANPLDPSSSTLLTHAELSWAGVKAGFTNPLGLGIAVTNGAAGVGDSDADERLDTNKTLAAGSASTDLDLSNAFVAYGAGGGFLFLGLVLLVLVTAARLYLRGSEIMLPIVGVLVANLGAWQVGGNYATSTLVWLLVGVVAARSLSAPSTREPLSTA